MTHCTADKTRLDGFADGTLPAIERARVSEHLTTCAECRQEVVELRAVLAATRHLPREILPPRDLWSGIEGRLDSTVTPFEIGRRRASTRTFRAVLAVAAALLLMVSGGALATLWLRRAEPATFASERARYQEATARLATQLVENPAGLTEASRAVLDRNLRIIDAAIQEAEAALAQEPGNAALSAMVLARYEQRLELLRHATDSERTES